MPRWILPATIILIALGLVPLALFARARNDKSQQTRIQLIPDMDQQPKYKSQMANPLFADGRAMRYPVEGTISRQGLKNDLHYYRGIVGATWATTFPIPVTESLMKRGQERYNIYCTPCHGYAGYGDGIVGKRAEELAQAEWVPPSSFHTDLVRGRPVGHLFNTISHGIRTMPPYGSQISEADRWAIVAYVRALQRSQNATLNDVPADMQPALR